MWLLWGCDKEVRPDNLEYPVIYNNLQTEDWEYLICNESEQLLVYKETDTGIVAFGINSPDDSNGYFIISNDSSISITSNTFNCHIVMKEDSVLLMVNSGDTSQFYRFGSDEVFNSQIRERKIDNCDILSALFSEIVKRTLGRHPIFAFLELMNDLRSFDRVSNTSQYIDWLEHRNRRYEKIFKWAKRKEQEHISIPTIIAGISTGGSRVEGITAYCLVDGYIKLQADPYFLGTINAVYGVCYSSSPNPTINDSKQVLSLSVGEGTLSQTAMLPYAFCLSGLEERTTYYYRAFYQIGSLDELVYGEIKQFTTEGLYEISTVASPQEGGSVNGGGRYPANTTITLSAIANNGFEFSHWEDGCVLSTRNVTIEGDASYTAYFHEVLPALPDLSGMWTFNQTYFAVHNLQLNMQLEDITETSASYRSSWGANSIYLHANADGSMSISTWSPYGASGTFTGTFNSSFTIASGEGYTQVTGTYGTTIVRNDPWSLTR